MRQMMSAVWMSALLLPLAHSSPGAAATDAPCTAQYNSTFEVITHEIFEKRGCTSTACHGAARSGGLDLRGEGVFDQLVDAPIGSIPAETHPGLKRVVPGRKDQSLLWLNLAAATLPELWQAPLHPMPLGLPPLTFDELDVIRLWIEEGAPRDGVVSGTGSTLGVCLPPPRPLRTEPLAAPPPGVGVQLRAPHQVLPPQSEREVCFISYYDFTDVVPEQFKGGDGQTFRYKRVEARQDPLSHHLVAIAYTGRASVHDRRWGAFTCKQGPHDGDPCEPTDPDACGPEGLCGSTPIPSVACIGFGPGDAGIGIGDKSLFNTMAAAAPPPVGVYEEAPIKGIIVWDSHAFNIWDEPADLDAWINFEFASPAEQQRPLQHFVDISAIGKMEVPAYGAEEICNYHVVPADMLVTELSSHVHKRGKRFRIFAGRFACAGGPHAGDPCSPFGPDPGVPVADLCAGAPCSSKLPPAVGDCNGDLDVTINEVVRGVAIALGQASVSDCPRFDRNEDGKVRIDEILGAVSSAISPRLRDPYDSLMYVSLTYGDPTVISLDPPLDLGGRYSTPAERTLTYCALYDNGFTNPDEVKRLTRIPSNDVACPPTNCAQGRVGAPCAGATPSANATCDSSLGSADGLCDACTVTFGVTTDNEMFVLTGTYIGK
jgi:hypothetical protein